MLCQTGLSSELVWFLHEVQVIAHMLNHLSELSGQGATESISATVDLLLHNEAAEEKGMWLVAISCIVDLITR